MRSAPHFKLSDHALGGVAVVGFLAIIAPRSLQVPPVVDAENAIVRSEDAPRHLQRGAHG